MAAWFAAGIAIIAAVIALSNANSARTQAGAALKQADEARKAREAAEAQVVEARNAVKAAEAQVEIAMRAADAAERSARAEEHGMTLAARQAHDNMAPKFTVKRHRGGVPCIEIKVIMEEGQPLAEVTLRTQGRNADIVEGFTSKQSGEMPVLVLSLGAMHKGDTHVLFVHGGPARESVTLAVDLHCVPIDKDAEPWTVTETFVLAQPARIISPASARIPRSTETGRRLFHDPPAF